MLLNRHTPPAGQAQGQLEAHHHVCHPGRISLCRGLPRRPDRLCTGGCPAPFAVVRLMSTVPVVQPATELLLFAHCLLSPLRALPGRTHTWAAIKPSAAGLVTTCCAHISGWQGPVVAWASMPAWQAVRYRPAPLGKTESDKLCLLHLCRAGSTLCRFCTQLCPRTATWTLH